MLLLFPELKSGREGFGFQFNCRDADKVSRRVADVLKDVASLEILQAPGLSFIVPDQFSSQPRLTGDLLQLLL